MKDKKANFRQSNLTNKSTLTDDENKSWIGSQLEKRVTLAAEPKKKKNLLYFIKYVKKAYLLASSIHFPIFIFTGKKKALEKKSNKHVCTSIVKLLTEQLGN